MLGNDGTRFTFAAWLRGAPPASGAQLVPDSRQSAGGAAVDIPARFDWASPAPSSGGASRAGGASARSQARFAATKEAPAQARQYVADELSTWGLPDGLRDDVVLVASELVSDAATYALAVTVELRLERRGDRVELELRDSCPEPPLRIDPASGAGELARAVLDTCSDHWSWWPEARLGRVVRASFGA